ncbi:MAG: hypothetical protein HY812_19340 [Planctomycetes bacterium]|nr:hypothetical protein [Planctomycetota bacterium]
MADSVRDGLNRLAGIYRQLDGRPVPGVTIVFCDGDGGLHPLSEEQRHRIGMTRTIMGLSALASREYFERTRYCTAAHFDLYGQRFQEGAEHIAIESRRRDGTSVDGRATEKLRIGCDPHVSSTLVSVSRDRTVVDEPVLDDSLLRLLETTAMRKDGFSRRALLSMELFLLGNRDGEFIRESEDVLLMQQATEHLLDSASRAHRFAVVVEKCLGVKGRASYQKGRRWGSRPSTSSYGRSGKLPSGELTTLGFWAYEFYQLRNDLVHGCDTSTRSWCWNLSEHALVASWVYPEILRRRCLEHLGQADGDRGVYWRDVALERLEDLDFSARGEDGLSRWAHAEANAEMKRMERDMMELLEGMDGEQRSGETIEP